MEGGWREADIVDGSSSRWAAGEEKQRDGGAAYGWAGDSLAVSSSTEAVCGAHEGYQDPKDEAIINANDKKARRYARQECSQLVPRHALYRAEPWCHCVSLSHRLHDSYRYYMTLALSHTLLC